MLDSNPDNPKGGYKQRIIRCNNDNETDVPCNSDRADFRAPDPTGSTTTTTTTTTTTPMSGNYYITIF